MVVEFLNLASQGSGSAPVASAAATNWSMVFIISVVLFILLGVVVAVLMRGMRRHLIDEPARRTRTNPVDPWAEAGRRLDRRQESAEPARRPPAADDAQGDKT